MVAWTLKRARSSVWMDLMLWTSWIIVLILSIIIPVYLGIQYLAIRGCYPHLNLDIEPEMIQSFLTPQPSSSSSSSSSPASLPPPSLPPSNLSTPDLPEVPEEDLMTSMLVGFFPPEYPVQVENSSLEVARLPRTLYRRGTIMVKREVKQYTVRSVSTMCTVNALKEKGVISLALAICNASIPSLDAREDIQEWLGALEDGVEDTLVQAVLNGGLEEAINVLPRMFPRAGLNASHTESLKHIIRPFTPTELTGMASALASAQLTDSDLAVLNAVMGNSSESLSNVNRALSKINPDNLPAIMENLNGLGIQLSEFISNPAVFIKYFGDPEKTKLLINLQQLLPKFKPRDIEAFLVFSKELEMFQAEFGDPNAPPVMSKLFSIPLDLLLGSLPKLKLGGEARYGLEAIQLLMEDDSFQLLQASAEEMQLMDPEARQRIMLSCADQQFNIRCRDTKDHCPHGLVLLGLSCLAPLVFPGIMYAVSTILHYRGSMLQCGIGKAFNLPSPKIAWVLILPLYLVMMIPWTLCLIVYRQGKVWFGLAAEARGKGQPLEADSHHFNNASNFGLLLGAGQGVLHLGVQGVVLGVVLLLGDVLLGVDKELYISSTLVVTVISLVLVLLTLAVSHLSSQEACRLSVDLATPPRSKMYLLSSLTWLLVSLLVTISSTLFLAILVYIDTVGFSEWRWSCLSLVVLVPLPLVQCIIYQLCVRTGAEHRFVWGLLASLIPVRFLDLERRRARLYLTLSQAVWFTAHLAAWVMYAIFVQATEGNSVVWRAWIPVVVPWLALPPLLAALHWNTSLSALYSATHAHPDMENESKRVRSFPPDWRQISGSNLSSESLAQAGFFYSCRRLKKAEATCFSCGRQVVDWSAKSAQEAHRSVTDTCPLYTDVKPSRQVDEGDLISSSCVPQFIFLSINILFRIASTILFLWVFWEAWRVVYPGVPSLLLIPVLFLVVLVLGNAALYYGCCGRGSLLWCLLSLLVPHPTSSLTYIIINLAFNTFIHLMLWSAMLGTSTTVFLLSWPRLRSTWPALVALAVLSALSTLPYWFLNLKPARDSNKARTNNKAVYVVSTSL